MTGCQFADLCGLIPCEREATVELTGMCVHEHLLVARACSEHVTQVDKYDTFCDECLRCGEPHRCAVQLLDERPLGFASDPVDRALDS